MFLVAPSSRGCRASTQQEQLLSLSCAGTGWKFPSNAMAQQLELHDSNSILSFYKQMENSNSEGDMFWYVYLVTSPLNLIFIIISCNLLYCFFTRVQGFNIETVCRRVFFCDRVKISELVWAAPPLCSLGHVAKGLCEGPEWAPEHPNSILSWNTTSGVNKRTKVVCGKATWGITALSFILCLCARGCSLCSISTLAPQPVNHGSVCWSYPDDCFSGPLKTVSACDLFYLQAKKQKQKTRKGFYVKGEVSFWKTLFLAFPGYLRSTPCFCASLKTNCPKGYTILPVCN